MDVFFDAVAPVYQHASQGGTVVTSNTRAARFLLNTFARHEQAAGLRAWRQADIVPWDAWTSRLWHGLLLGGHEDRICLSSEQERVAWESLLSAQGKAGLAGTAQAAWLLLWAYTPGAGALDRHPEQGDPAKFREWCAQFSATLGQRRWVTQAELPHVLAANAAHLADEAPPVLFYAFDRFTPAQQRLRSALARHASVSEFHPQVSASSAVKTSFADMPQSVTAAACWARASVEAAEAAGGRAKLAVITPKASAARGEVQRVFSRVLGPDAFQFSLGTPLAHQPAASVALTLLRWLAGPLALRDISEFMLSPHAGQRGGDAPALRARLDAALRRDCKLTLPEYSLRDFSRELRDRVARIDRPWHTLEPLSKQAAAASRFAAEQLEPDGGQPPSRWAGMFAQYLAKWDFTLPADADRREYQVWRSWQSLLDAFATLDFDEQPRDLDWALTTLDRMARETIFQPAASEVPVEVLGPLEAAGSLFDGIFFLDADEGSWPQSGAPHALLPAALQREAGMPHGSFDTDYAASEQVTERLLRSANTLAFTWPLMSASGELRPSFLLEDIPAATDEWHEQFPRQEEKTADLTASTDEDTSPRRWTDDRGTVAANTLKQQSACPFQAFAANRLAAAGLESREDGLDARERGTLLHALLQNVWMGDGEPAGLRDSVTLKQHLLDNTLEDFVRAHANALKRRGGHGAWQDAFHALEMERVTGRVLQWLAIEAERTPFAVLSVEQKEAVELGGLRFSLRIDRTDSLLDEGGRSAGVVLIDYKTGTLPSKPWDGERMEEPQLPLYAQTVPAGKLLGFGFGSLKIGCVEFQGALSEDAAFAIPADKPEKLEKGLPYWTANLTRLARDFSAGRSPVDPLDSRKDCRYCEFPTLCRVTENLHVVAEQDVESEYDT